MIKGLTGSDGVFVENGNTSMPYINQNNTNPMQGMIRIYGTDLQAFDGTAWINLPSSYATIRMDSGIVNWVREKQSKEQEQRKELEYLKRRAEEHPSLKKAYQAIIRAEEQLNERIDKAVADFKILDKLVGEEQNNEGMFVQMPMPAP
jgi:hypothetical protein